MPLAPSQCFDEDKMLQLTDAFLIVCGADSLSSLCFQTKALITL